MNSEKNGFMKGMIKLSLELVTDQLEFQSVKDDRTREVYRSSIDSADAGLSSPNFRICMAVLMVICAVVLIPAVLA